MQIEYPFLRYSIFNYLYVLSFYERARRSNSFAEAMKAFESKLVGGKVVVENPNRKLAGLGFCRKGKVSRLATKRYVEMRRNIDGRSCAGAVTVAIDRIKHRRR
jgi:hypothetical protein